MALLFVSAPLALAHDGHTDTGKGPPTPNTHCWPDQNPHDYGSPGSASYGVGVTGYVANDHNTEDCNGDGTLADFDGDPEYGLGGGFLPAGPWATDPTCDYGYTDHHAASFHVHSEAPAEPSFYASFTVGADPSAPTFVTDPVTGEVTCVDDGCVCTGGPDADDWVQHCVHACAATAPPGNTNPFYGLPGGNGGYHVWVHAPSEAGHIYSPGEATGGEEGLCTAPHSAGLPCLVDGEPTPRENVRCLAANLSPSCYLELPSGDGPVYNDAAPPNLGGDGSGGVELDSHCTPYVDAHGTWGRDSTYGWYLDARAGPAYVELHHCSDGPFWSQSLWDFWSTSGTRRTTYGAGHDQVLLSWGDMKFHWTCAQFRLQNDAWIGRCFWMYN